MRFLPLLTLVAAAGLLVGCDLFESPTEPEEPEDLQDTSPDSGPSDPGAPVDCVKEVEVYVNRCGNEPGPTCTFGVTFESECEEVVSLTLRWAPYRDGVRQSVGDCAQSDVAGVSGSYVYVTRPRFAPGVTSGLISCASVQLPWPTNVRYKWRACRGIADTDPGCFDDFAPPRQLDTGDSLEPGSSLD